MTSLCWYTRATNNIDDANKRFNYRRSCDSEELAKTPFDIFVASVRSHIGKGFSSVRVCVDIDDSVSEQQRLLLFNLIREIAPVSSIVESRPHTIHEWLSEMNKAKDFFGDSPILFHYNHDHVYLGPPIAQVITTDIERLIAFNSSFVMTTDYPLWVCLSDPFYFSTRYSDCIVPTRLAHLPGVGGSQWSLHRIDWGNKGSCGISLHGECLCSAESMMTIWSSLASIKQNCDIAYVPRPDWTGIIQPVIPALLYVPPIELCTHYDGYGYVTSLTRYIAPVKSNDTSCWIAHDSLSFSACGLLSPADLARFIRHYFILISRLYFISKASFVDSPAAMRFFHDQVQRVTTEWSTNKLSNDYCFSSLDHDTFKKLADLLVPIKSSLISVVDNALPFIVSDMYQE